MELTNRSIAVIGLGTFGMKLALELTRFGNRVLAVDAEEGPVSAMATRIDRALIANAAEELAVREAGIGDYDMCVVAIASNLEANLMAVMNARRAGCRIIWAKSSSETHTQILKEIGVDRVLHPETTYAELIAQQIHNPLILGSVKLAADLHFAMIVAPERTCGRELSDLLLLGSRSVRCVGLLRADEFVEPGKDETVQPGDGILLIGSRDSLRSFADKQ